MEPDLIDVLVEEEDNDTQKTEALAWGKPEPTIISYQACLRGMYYTSGPV